MIHLYHFDVSSVSRLDVCIYLHQHHTTIMSTSDTDRSHPNPNFDGRIKQTDQAIYDADRHYAFAIRFDSPRDIQRAIYHYEQSIAALTYADPERRLFTDKYQMYFDRIHALQSELKESPVKPENKISTHDVKPTTKFADVIGLQEAKDALRAGIIYPAQRPDLYNNIQSKHNVLLYGPHGCGKSLLASAVGAELNATVMAVELGSIYGKYYGDAEKQLKTIFDDARQLSQDRPIVMVIDEVDGLMSRKGSDSATESRVIGILLSELDGVNTQNNFVILAMTNRPWDLDVGFIRRFPRRILVTLPGQDARVELFKLHLSKLKTTDMDYTKLARMYDGYNAADIKQICLDAHATTIHELMTSPHYNEKQQPRSINMNDFTIIKKNRKSSVSPDILHSCHNWHHDFGA